MKIFWSWQSDTPGDTGRHFVRAALTDAIKRLKEPEEVEEPFERERRKAIHLDHDRLNVSGTPELARLIFEKIALSAVFVADVTTVGEARRYAPVDAEDETKKLINANVAIEYGYAVKAIGDHLILLIQNLHFGAREDLPFDLKHKAGPIQYRLEPGAGKEQIAAEKTQLVGKLVVALRECLATISRSAPAASKFEEVKSTINPAVFWDKGEIIAKYGSRGFPGTRHRSEEDEAYEFTFDETRALYVRLIPVVPSPNPHRRTRLFDIAQRRSVRVLTRTINSGTPFLNRFGAIFYESRGSDRVLSAFTQLFSNGEIWGVTTDFWVPHAGAEIVAAGNVERRIWEGMTNFMQVARDELQIAPPYTIELGIVGMTGMRISLPEGTSPYHNQVTDEVYADMERLRVFINEPTRQAVDAVVTNFLTALYDLAGVEYPLR